LTPETYELSGSEIFEHSPGYNRLIIKIVPKMTCDSLYSTKENLNRIKSMDSVNNFNNSNSENSNSTNTNSNNSIKNNNSVYNSNVSVYSSGEREVVLFLGFEESWERDLWSSWLLEVSFFFVVLAGTFKKNLGS
jgi:hypothetical protein